MEVVLARKDPSFEPREWTKKPRYAHDRHADHYFSSGDGLVVRDADTGEHVLTFLPFTALPEQPLLDALRQLRFQENYRTEGLKSRSCTFGFQPRIPIRRDFCSVAASAYQRPEAHRTLIQYGRETARIYERHLPELYANQQAELASVKPEWREPNTHFTSGIANDRNVLHYHRDQGNFPGALSTMLALTRDMGETSGKLVLPEYKIGIEFHGFELLIFNGAQHVHGVTPIKLHSPMSYRYTVVYYALQAMCRCGTQAEELDRIKKLKTQREIQRTSENEEALKQKLLAKTGIDEEEMKRLGERKHAHFERKKRRPK